MKSPVTKSQLLGKKIGDGTVAMETELTLTVPESHWTTRCLYLSDTDARDRHQGERVLSVGPQAGDGAPQWLLSGHNLNGCGW